MKHLAAELTTGLGCGFSVDNLESMRTFYLAYPPNQISETSSRMSLEGDGGNVCVDADTLFPDLDKLKEAQQEHGE